MQLEWSTIALQLVNFAVLAWLLQRFLYRPVLRLIEARKLEVERQYDRARAAEAKAQVELSGIEAQRAQIAEERNAALKAMAAQAEEAAQGRRTQAEREAQALLDQARKTLEVERERALDEARRVALDLGTACASRLLAEVPVRLRAEAWIERLEEHLREMSKPELTGLVGQLEKSGSLTVVTAEKLPPETEENWRHRLRQLLGTTVNVAFAANPELIAGVELNFPTAVLHFSWQRALATMRSELEAHADAH